MRCVLEGWSRWEPRKLGPNHTVEKCPFSHQCSRACPCARSRVRLCHAGCSLVQGLQGSRAGLQGGPQAAGNSLKRTGLAVPTAAKPNGSATRQSPWAMRSQDSGIITIIARGVRSLDGVTVAVHSAAPCHDRWVTRACSVYDLTQHRYRWRQQGEGVVETFVANSWAVEYLPAFSGACRGLITPFILVSWLAQALGIDL
jgi:hypothetical protein